MIKLVCKKCGVETKGKGKIYLCRVCSHKGIIFSEESRKKLSIALKGRHVSKETRRKISQARKGIQFSEETRKRMSDAHRKMKKPWVTAYFKGKTYEEISPETSEIRKQKTSKRISGEKNYFYKDGISLDYKRDRERINKYTKKKWSSDINFKLSLMLRNRVNISLKKRAKSGSAVKDLGCSIEQLRFYLEGKFQDGMTWNNWSRGGWHIDHIIPLAMFDLTNREQFKSACHYTNLQPMWATENYRKGVLLEYKDTI